METLFAIKKIFSWMNKVLFGATIEFTYYMVKNIFSWSNNIFCLSNVSWFHQTFYLVWPKFWLMWERILVQTSTNFGCPMQIFYLIRLKIVVDRREYFSWSKKTFKLISQKPELKKNLHWIKLTKLFKQIILLIQLNKFG